MYVTASESNVLLDFGGKNITALASSLNNISWVNPSIDVLLAYYRYLLIFLIITFFFYSFKKMISFMIHIKYYKFKNIFNVTSFKLYTLM